MVHFEPTDEAPEKPRQATGVAPVTYLPGAAPGMERRSPLERTPRGTAKTRFERNASEDTFGSAEADTVTDTDTDTDADTEAGAAEVAAAERDRAETMLLHRLRGRSLSTVEACAVLTATDIDLDDAVEIIERFTALHYLDEEKLADQIIHSHHVRKGLGRTGVEAEMRRRKLDPAVMLDKLEELPDDEAERAIELAVKRIGQMDRFDDQTIDRRLTGFLMRKGYGSAAVRLAVKSALASRGGGPSGVRFR